MININVNPKEVIFLDIETVRGAESLFKMPKQQVEAWVSATKYISEKEGISARDLFTRDAALYPEFGKIVCISLGYFKENDEFNVKAFVNDNEAVLLKEVGEAISKASAFRKNFAGHNIKRFDFPWIIRRAVVNKIHLPISFDIFGKKPWDLDYILDTMEIWQSTAFGLGSNSLQSISAALDLGNPKEEMSGDMVSTVYYNSGDGDRLLKIGTYCNNDVVQCAKLFVRYSKTECNFNVSNIL